MQPLGTGMQSNLRFCSGKMYACLGENLMIVVNSLLFNHLYLLQGFKSEIDSNAYKWENTLVGYVLGDKPFYMHLKACVHRMWRPSCSLDIFSRENGYFFFKFGTKEECNRILQTGPWLFDGRLISLKQWSPDLGSEMDLLASVPVWIRLPGLYLKFWLEHLE